jgi:dihydrofolate reductase
LNIITSEYGGFCPGVRQADKKIRALLEEKQSNEKIYIIGGASVYTQALPLADVLCITEIDAEAPAADTYFPTIDPSIWKENSRESHPTDEKHEYPYAFVEYIRR